jgi:uncharacterized membrane protein YdjX (TVP38/TMEM64 family)
MDLIINEIVDIINSLGVIGALLGCLIILIESIIPIIPLMVFITLNFYVFGTVFGFILSWIFTLLGCIISYMIFKYGFGNKFDYLTENKEKLKKYKNAFKNISIPKLAIIIAIPFTPAFMVNISAGLVKMDFKKYLLALLIGKIGLVYFWGFVGTSFLDSIGNPLILLKIIIIILCTYLLSKILNKVFKI